MGDEVGAKRARDYVWGGKPVRTGYYGLVQAKGKSKAEMKGVTKERSFAEYV